MWYVYKNIAHNHYIATDGSRTDELHKAHIFAYMPGKMLGYKIVSVRLVEGEEQ